MSTFHTPCLIMILLAATAAHGEPNPDASAYRSLYADRKAYAIGDTVQILIIESTQAESSAGTGSTSSTGFNASGRADDGGFVAALGIGGDASGNGQTSRTGSLRSVVTAQVSAITGEGNLVLDANQEVAINDETQRIVIHGIARPLDISAENYVASNRLAQATIRISGTGSVSSAQRRGIVFRFLKWIHVL